jgi:hypothetical protein
MGPKGELFDDQDDRVIGVRLVLSVRSDLAPNSVNEADLFRYNNWAITRDISRDAHSNRIQKLSNALTVLRKVDKLRCIVG